MDYCLVFMVSNCGVRTEYERLTAEVVGLFLYCGHGI
jgi:hypothetical protein